jgi:hypothetical protein
MENLDRVLDRDDVLMARAVDVVEHRRERRRLARAGRAGAEHKAAVLLGEPPHPRRQLERLEARHVAGNDPERKRDVAALAKGVDPEPRQALRRVRDVEVAALVEGLQPLGRDEGHRLEGGEQVLLAQRRALLERRDHAVATQHRRLVQLQVDVARAELDGAPEEGIQVHRASREESAGLVPCFRGARSRRSGGRGRPRASLGMSDLSRSSPAITRQTAGAARSRSAARGVPVEHELRLPRRVGEAAERRVQLALVAGRASPSRIAAAASRPRRSAS